MKGLNCSESFGKASDDSLLLEDLFRSFRKAWQGGGGASVLFLSVSFLRRGRGIRTGPLASSSLGCLFRPLKPRSEPLRASIRGPMSPYTLWRFRTLDGPIRANRFADSRESPDSRESSRGSRSEPLFCKSRFRGLKIANRSFEAIRANRWHVMKIVFFLRIDSCESIRASRPNSRCESPGHLSFVPFWYPFPLL